MNKITNSFDKSELKDFPTNPGVYIMRNKAGDVIYVGKAINLKNRVRSYFRDPKGLSEKTRALVSHIDSIETIVVGSELESLILECSLIKEYQPKYNIALRDGKTYPYIMVTTSEAYPRVVLTRERHKDDNLYFGPYTSSYAARKFIDALNRLFPLKMCGKPAEPGKKAARPCLNFHLGQCLAPCTGEVDSEMYHERVDMVIKILQGQTDDIIAEVTEKMNNAAENLEFEVAATMRDQISAIKHISEKQRIISQKGHDRDIIALYKDRDLACLQIFNVRAGELVGRDHSVITGVYEEDSNQILAEAIKQYYIGGALIPEEILIAEEISGKDKKEITDLVTNEKGKKVSLLFPKRGEKVRLIELARENAKIELEQYEARKMARVKELEDKTEALANFLQLSKINRIEAFDISNISGTNNVGGMVVFTDGRSDRKAYRRFKIKSVSGQDDYKSMQEMVVRRIERGIKEESKAKSSFLPFPEVFAIDGGETHVKAIEEILSLYPQLKIKVIGLVKDNHHRIRGIIYNRKEYPLEFGSPLSKFLSEISEEVHRYAVSYHRKLRKNSMLESELERIPGIGKKRRRELMRHFGNLKNIRNAGLEELAAIPSMNKTSATAVFDHFRGE